MCVYYQHSQFVLTNTADTHINRPTGGIRLAAHTKLKKKKTHNESQCVPTNTIITRINMFSITQTHTYTHTLTQTCKHTQTHTHTLTTRQRAR